MTHRVVYVGLDVHKETIAVAVAHGDPPAHVEHLGAAGRRFRLPDGTTRYLVDEAMLVSLTRSLDGQLLDPIKTTIVQDQRAMSTWVVRKAGTLAISRPAPRSPSLC